MGVHWPERVVGQHAGVATQPSIKPGCACRPSTSERSFGFKANPLAAAGSCLSLSVRTSDSCVSFLTTDRTDSTNKMSRPIGRRIAPGNSRCSTPLLRSCPSDPCSRVGANVIPCAQCESSSNCLALLLRFQIRMDSFPPIAIRPPSGENATASAPDGVPGSIRVVFPDSRSSPGWWAQGIPGQAVATCVIADGPLTPLEFVRFAEKVGGPRRPLFSKLFRTCDGSERINAPRWILGRIIRCRLWEHPRVHFCSNFQFDYMKYRKSYGRGDSDGSLFTIFASADAYSIVTGRRS